MTTTSIIVARAQGLMIMIKTSLLVALALTGKIVAYLRIHI